MNPLVLVDARNVLRSRWPNVPGRELIERSRVWADDAGVETILVFDGTAPDGGVGTGAETADDWIARRAAELAEEGRPYWLVTSDRELRERAGTRAERVIGGGSFIGMLGLR